MAENDFQIDPIRPDDLSLDSESSMNISSSSKNKSAWQSFVDMNGFRQRHPTLILGKKKNARKKSLQKRK